jgi:hypothetical protein
MEMSTTLLALGQERGGWRALAVMANQKLGSRPANAYISCTVLGLSCSMFLLLFSSTSI